MRDDDCQYIHITRPVLTSVKLRTLVDGEWEEPKRNPLMVFRTILRKTKAYFLPTPLKSGMKSRDSTQAEQSKRNCCLWGAWLLTFFPCVQTLRTYNFRSWLINDLIAGFTVGIMHVPQGMAYALLATLPPVHGLYTSLFPPLVYFIFGTSRHVSIGAIAVISLLTGDFLDKKVQGMLSHADMFNDNGSSTASPSSEMLRVKFAPAMAAAVGLTQVIMGVLKLGSMTRYLSSPMVSGFTVGVAVHVLTSQVRTLLGVTSPKPNGLFAIPRMYYELFRNITTTNVVTVGLSAACITVLAIVKTWINPKVTKRIRIPIPIDLITLILATVTSDRLELNQKYNVSVVGEIGRGIPPPLVPAINELSDSITDILVIAIVAYSVSISMARILAKELDYKVDANQELYANGFSNSLGSFFQTIPVAASLSRSAVQLSAGGKTQITTVVSSGLLLVVIYFFGPYLFSLPLCCLSAVIVVALKGMFAHALELKDLWKYSLWDFSIWTLTCICTVILDVKFGLLFGVAFSALTIVLRTQSPSARLIRKAVGTEFYCEFDADSDQTVSAPVRVVRYEGSLYYACADHFRQVIFEKSCVDPVHLFSKLQHIRRKLNALHRRMDLDVFAVEKTIGPGSQAFGNQELHSTFVGNDETTPSAFTTRPAVTTSMKFDSDGTSQNKLSDVTGRNRETELLSQLAALENACALQYLVLDCTSWNFIDFVGADELKQITEDYKKVGVRISLAGLKDKLRELLLSNGKLPEEVETFPSVYDAVKAATANLTSNSEHLREIHSMIAAQKDSNTTFVDSNLPDNNTNNVDFVDSPIK